VAVASVQGGTSCTSTLSGNPNVTFPGSRIWHLGALGEYALSQQSQFIPAAVFGGAGSLTANLSHAQSLAAVFNASGSLSVLRTQIPNIRAQFNGTGRMCVGPTVLLVGKVGAVSNIVVLGPGVTNSAVT
jgi:hypothetical protein